MHARVGECMEGSVRGEKEVWYQGWISLATSGRLARLQVSRGGAVEFWQGGLVGLAVRVSTGRRVTAA